MFQQDFHADQDENDAADNLGLIRPSGSAPISVTKNNFKVCRKPSFRAPMTVKNMSMESSFSVIS